jgi:hypothetical protein
MQLLVFATIGMMLFVVAIAIDLGGTLAALIFLTIMLIGGILRAWAPLVAWVRGPSAGAS